MMNRKLVFLKKCNSDLFIVCCEMEMKTNNDCIFSWSNEFRQWSKCRAVRLQHFSSERIHLRLLRSYHIHLVKWLCFIYDLMLAWFFDCWNVFLAQQNNIFLELVRMWTFLPYGNRHVDARRASQQRTHNHHIVWTNATAWVRVRSPLLNRFNYMDIAIFIDGNFYAQKYAFSLLLHALILMAGRNSDQKIAKNSNTIKYEWKKK